jgi:diacylglycerol O-acyltransferase
VTTMLTAIDAAFLHVDRLGSPIHVGGVMVFEAGPLLDQDGELLLDDIRRLVAARLPEVPKLRCRISGSPGGVTRPSWVADEDFAIADHVDAVALPDGSGDDALRALAEALYAEPLDPSKPLWHLRFVTGLDGDRVAVVERIHHALVDGVSGVDLATVLLDVTPEPRPVVDHDDGIEVQAGGDGLLDLPAAVLRSAASVARHPATFVRRLADIAAGFGEVAGGGLRAPRSSLNAPVGTARALRWIGAPLDEVRAVGKDHGGTVNDVVLAAVAGGVRSLLLARGEVVPPDATTRVLVPVSVRTADEHGALGNKVAALLVDVPIGLGDPDERIRAVARVTAHLKASHEADASAALLGAADLLPAAALRVAGPLVAHQPLVNLVVTNVPGVPVPLYLRGARMLVAHPFVPVTGNLTVNVAVLSYVDDLRLGITADRERCADVDAFVAGIAADLTRLGVAARR